MKNRVFLPFSHDKPYARLAADNAGAVRDFNEKTLSVLSFIGGLLMILSLIAIPSRMMKPGGLVSHLTSGFLLFGFHFLFKLSGMKKYTLPGIYASFSVLFSFAVYNSVFQSPDARATVLIGAFCVMPMAFIDRPLRINLFELFWLLFHTALAYRFKALHVWADTVNILCFSLLSCLLGSMMVYVRLENYDARRLLTIERDTDVLTGLSNRRNLLDALHAMASEDAEKPSGIMMLDIDNFKAFNDDWGHAAGDECLVRLGEMLIMFSMGRRMQFYRYGGEEFVGIIYGCSEKGLLSIAEDLRAAAQGMDVNGQSITISVGAVYCGGMQLDNYEDVIIWADKASYMAKRFGRNQVCVQRCDRIA